MSEISRFSWYPHFDIFFKHFIRRCRYCSSYYSHSATMYNLTRLQKYCTQLLPDSLNCRTSNKKYFPQTRKYFQFRNLSNNLEKNNNSCFRYPKTVDRFRLKLWFNTTPLNQTVILKPTFFKNNPDCRKNLRNWNRIGLFHVAKIRLPEIWQRMIFLVFFVYMAKAIRI
jgi:hypothetical protein